MKQIREAYKNKGELHHAYLIFGEREGVQAELFDFLDRELEFPVKNNPDFWIGEFNVFKIDDSRAVTVAHLNRPVKYGRKVFVISADFMTRGAQNSLLKIFEEPKADTIFFLIMPSATDLLPTLKSRLQIISATEPKPTAKSSLASKGGSGENDIIIQAEEFLLAKVGKRLLMTAKILKDIKDEKATKAQAVGFIKHLERLVKAEWKVKKNSEGRGQNILAVEDLERAISYAGDESPSLKVILEHLALVLPSKI